MVKDSEIVLDVSQPETLKHLGYVTDWIQDPDNLIERITANSSASPLALKNDARQIGRLVEEWEDNLNLLRANLAQDNFDAMPSSLPAAHNAALLAATPFLDPHWDRRLKQGFLGINKTTGSENRKTAIRLLLEMIAKDLVLPLQILQRNFLIAAEALQSPNIDETSIKKRTKKGEVPSWLIPALHLLEIHPDWSDAKIANEVGVNKSTLSRNATYSRARKVAGCDRKNIPNGRNKFDEDSQPNDVDSATDGKFQDRGQPIQGSKMFREYCHDCEEPMRVPENQLGDRLLCDCCNGR